MAAGLLPGAAAAEPSRHEHVAPGRLDFQCGGSQVSLRVFGSEADGYQSVVLSADVGGTRYFAGSSFLSGAPTEVSMAPVLSGTP